MSSFALFLRPFLQARFAPRTGFNILTSKRGNKNFYKGKGGRSLGKHTKLGGYRLLDWKLPDYVVPDLTNFEVRSRGVGLAWNPLTRAAHLCS